MEQDQESSTGYLEKIAMITDAMDKIFPTAQSAMIFELDESDFKSIKSYFRQINKENGRFKIDISGVEVIFMLKGYEPPIEKKEVGKFKQIFKLLTSKNSS